MHCALPSDDSVLFSQAVHDDEPAVEYSFFAQVKQEVEGETVVPAAQKVHSDIDTAPTMGRYLPPGQALHGSGLSVTGHAEQFDAPAMAAYLPTAQVEHVDDVAPSSSEYLPFSHKMHTLSEPAPATLECLPAAHLTQEISEAAPTSVEYLPLSQSWQLVDASLSA